MIHGLLHDSETGEDELVQERRGGIDVERLGEHLTLVQIQLGTQPHMWLQLSLSGPHLTHVFRQRPILERHDVPGRISLLGRTPIRAIIHADGRIQLHQDGSFLSFRLPFLDWSQLNHGPPEVKRDGRISREGLLLVQNAGMHFRRRGRRTWLVPDEFKRHTNTGV